MNCCKMRIEKENIIIAGNGPSLREIDYKRLPEEYDVFRCNQFYFEDKYYLGKSIKMAFFNPSVFFEQYYTAMQLKIKQEYFIDNIVCSTFNLSFIDNTLFLKSFHNWYCEAYLGYDFLSALDKFNSYIKYNEIYYNQRITSSIYMCAVAIALGYKNIFLTGVDFYDKDKDYYSFDTKKDNLIKLNPSFDLNHSQSDFHSKDVDLRALEFLMANYPVNVYSVVPNSILSQYIKVSDYSSEKDFEIIQKYDYIDDICIPTKSAIYDYYKSIFSKSDKILYEADCNSISNIEQQISMQAQAVNQVAIRQNKIIYEKTAKIKELYQTIQEQKLTISHLSFRSKYNLAKQRIQNHLAYKLGQAMTINSKSLLGSLSLPFILLSLIISHKQEQKAYHIKVKKNPNLALPPLEEYPDYQEALREKECFTYKLGKAFIKANKNWYKGGYFKLWFEIRRLKKEFRSKK